MIDEAYVDFGAQSAITLIDRYPNLLVVHTTSKARSLAGMRVGFAFGDAALIDALNRVKDSFNSYPLDRLAQVAAQAAYEDTDYFNATCRRVIDSRSRLTHALDALGFDIVPSAANFVFARHPAHDAGAIAAELKERRFSCGTSGCRGSTSTCASPSAPTPNAMRSSRRCASCWPETEEPAPGGADPDA